jgi:hypothetical protein
VRVVDGVTGPKPVQYRVTVSPARAGRVVVPAGAACLPSDKTAPADCVPAEAERLRSK